MAPTRTRKKEKARPTAGQSNHAANTAFAADVGRLVRRGRARRGITRRQLAIDFQRLAMTDVPLVELVEIISNTVMAPNLRNAAPGTLQFIDTWGSLYLA